MQSQKERSMTCQQQKSSTTLAPTESSITSEEAFDAMRQAAMTMFRQRTKDLTKLSQLQEHHSRLVQVQAEVQTGLDKLQEHQAQLEALVEKEDLRSKERAAELQQLHEAMSCLSEEQRVLHSVSRTTVRVAELASTAFKADNEPGIVVRLMKLMEAAQARNAGRTTGDFCHLSSELRRREAALREHLEEARRTGAVPKTFYPAIQEWLRGNWRQHKELTAVVAQCEELLALRPLSDSGSSGATSRAETPASSSPWSALAAYPVTFDEEGLFNLAENPDGEAGAQKIIGHYLAELTAIAERGADVTGACEQFGVVCDVGCHSLAPVKEGWNSFLLSFADWCALTRECSRVLTEAADADLALSQMEAKLHDVESSCVSCDAVIEEAGARETLLSEEFGNYASTWNRACHTACMQEKCCADLAAQTEELKVQLRAAEAARDAIAASADQTAEEQKQTLRDMEDAASRVSASVAAAQTEHIGLLTNTTNLTQLNDRLDVINMYVKERLGYPAAPRSPDGNAALGDPNALVRELDALGEGLSDSDGDGEWRGSLLSTSSFSEQAADAANALIAALTSSDPQDKTPLIALLCQYEPLKPFLSPSEHACKDFEAMVEGIFSSLRDAQAASAEHNQFTVDAGREIELLQTELS